MGDNLFFIIYLSPLSKSLAKFSEFFLGSSFHIRLFHSPINTSLKHEGVTVFLSHLLQQLNLILLKSCFGQITHLQNLFFFFSVLSYCLLNKTNTTFIYGEKKTQNCCSVHTIKHFYKMLPLFMPFPPPRDNVLSFFSTYPNSTHHLRLRPDVISTRILPLISSSGSEPSFPGNLAVLNFDSFYHSFHTPCVLK